MVLYDPRSKLYVHNYEDLCLLSDIDAQMLYFLFSLMDFVLLHVIDFHSNTLFKLISSLYNTLYILVKYV